MLCSACELVMLGSSLKRSTRVGPSEYTVTYTCTGGHERLRQPSGVQCSEPLRAQRTSRIRVSEQTLADAASPLRLGRFPLSSASEQGPLLQTTSESVSQTCGPIASDGCKGLMPLP